MRRVLLAGLALVATVACGGNGGQARACGPVERPQLQGGAHLIGDAEPPVPYSSTPGTSGYHAGGQPRTGVFSTEDPLPEPQLVLALEVGQAVAAYDPDALPEEEIAQLRELATGDLEGQLTVTPFAGEMGAPLTLNAWGTRQPCERVEPEVVRAFVDEFAGQDLH